MAGKLTAKQKAFCEYYVQCGNATQAAIKAGYSKKYAGESASKTTRSPAVKEYIKELQKEIKTNNIIDARQIQEELTAIILQESDEEVIVNEDNDAGLSKATTKKKKPSQADRIKAMQLLAKMQGALDNNTNLNIVLPVFGGEEDIEK